MYKIEETEIDIKLKDKQNIRLRKDLSWLEIYQENNLRQPSLLQEINLRHERDRKDRLVIALTLFGLAFLLGFCASCLL